MHRLARAERMHGGVLFAGVVRAVLADGVPAGVQGRAAYHLRGRQPQDALGGGVADLDGAPGALQHQPLLHGLHGGVELLGELAQGGLGLLPLGHRAPERELADDLTAQGGQGGLLRGGEGPGDPVNDAQGAERVALHVDQRCAGVESNAGIAGDERVVGEARVGLGVGDDHQVGLQEGVGAEGDIAGGFAHVQPDDALEPLALFVHE